MFLSKKKSRHNHKGIVMNELNIHFLCWLHIYSSEFTLSVYVRDPSLRITFRSCTHPLGFMLKVSHYGLCWIFPTCPSRATLCASPLSSVLGNWSVWAVLRLSSSLAFAQVCPKGSTIRKLKAKRKMSLKMWLLSSPHFASNSSFLFWSLSGAKNLSLPLSLAGFPLSFLCLL